MRRLARARARPRIENFSENPRCLSPVASQQVPAEQRRRFTPASKAGHGCQDTVANGDRACFGRNAVQESRIGSFESPDECARQSNRRKEMGCTERTRTTRRSDTCRRSRRRRARCRPAVVGKLWRRRSPRAGASLQYTQPSRRASCCRLRAHFPEPSMWHGRASEEEPRDCRKTKEKKTEYMVRTTEASSQFVGEHWSLTRPFRTVLRQLTSSTHLSCRPPAIRPDTPPTS